MTLPELDSSELSSASRAAKIERRLLATTALVITTAVLVLRFASLPTRQFDPDELEHAHVAWSIAQGAVPYRDLFEHHTPLFHYLLSALLGPLHPERSGAAGLGALLLAREVTWAMSALVIGLTALLARRLYGPATAWVTLALTATSIVVGLRAPEIRPDGLSTALWIGCLILFDAALRHRSPAGWRGSGLFMASGLSISLAVLTSQKLLLAGPVLALVVCLYVLGRCEGTTLRQRVGNVTWQALGVILPWSLAWAFFWSRGAARVFVDFTFGRNMGWIAETSASKVLTFVAQYDPWLLALGAGGMVVLISDTWALVREHQTGREKDPGWLPPVLFVSSTLGMFAGLFIIPVPYPQYCLTFMPLCAIVAARLLVHAAEAMSQTSIDRRSDRTSRRGGLATLSAAAIVAASTAMVTLGVAHPFIVRAWVYPTLLAVGILALALLPVYRRPALALSAVLAVLAIYPVQWTTWLAALDDGRQYAAIRYVLDRTPQRATVMDGWTGYGVFRPHAWYYWMLHSGVRAGIPPREVAALEEDVLAGRIRPDLVVLDADLRRFSSRIAAHVETTYRPTPVTDVYVRDGP